MLFQNISFFLLCALSFAFFWGFPSLRLGILAIANALFYLAAGWANLLLFLASSAITYALGKHVTGQRGKALLFLGILLNLANLGFFKYAAFLGGSLYPWLAPSLLKQVLLPIGISFYTFQNISYLVDRRTRELAPADSYLHYWVYISFFGHSIAGPIMRGAEFLPQVTQASALRLQGRELRYGLYLFLLGLFKKVVVADQLSGPANTMFAHASSLSFGEAWAAALMFCFQIYFDFSAYSDMAVGIGHMFGFRLSVNFRTPYVAANASEFWARWHITLSQWIRDYVYIPLGGNRCSPSRAQLNLFVAMLASGLWHGAAWTYVFWGAFHGLLLLGQRIWARLKSGLGWRFFETRAYRAIAIACFFVLLVFSWVLFRASSLEDALNMWRNMLSLGDWRTLRPVAGLFAAGLGLYGLHWLEFTLRSNEGFWAERWVWRVPVPVQGLAYAVLVLAMMVSFHGAQDFIYFKF